MTLKLLGNLPKGLIFVLSAPAGTGKTTLVRMLLDEFPSLAVSVSCTTRSPRPEEISGRDYYFLSKKEFQRKVEEDEFLEHAEVFGNHYGTSRVEVEKLQSEGKHVILVIDTQGGMQLMEEKVDATFIFVKPPSFAELRERLFKRRTESADLIEQRLSWAEKEIEAGSHHYDYQIVNDNLHHAYEILRSILIAEEHKVRRNHDHERTKRKRSAHE